MKNIKTFLLVASLLFVSSTAISIHAHFQGDTQTEQRYAIIALCTAGIVAFSEKASVVLGAAVTVLSRFSSALENNTYIGQGILAFTQAYAATSALVLKAAKEQHVCYAQLTGAMTINATLTNLRQFDIIFFHFATDGTQRIVTFGTGFVSSGTLTIAASKDATAWGVFDGTNIKILGREVQA